MLLIDIGILGITFLNFNTQNLLQLIETINLDPQVGLIDTLNLI